MITAKDTGIYGRIKTKGEQLAELVKMAEDIQSNNDKIAAEVYQHGLEDAWKLAEDVIYNRGNVLDILRCATVGAAFDKYSAGQALDILKEYEKKQKDSINVGDEVVTRGVVPGNTFLVTKVTESTAYGISNDGSWNFYNKDSVTKTGKHYDIASILEAMRTHD